MDERRQNELICDFVGWHEAVVCESGSSAYIQVQPYNARSGARLRECDWFTRSHENLHLMHKELLSQGKAQGFIDELDDLRKGDVPALTAELWAFDLMQATPAQQVEAALRVLGQWEGRSQVLASPARSCD
jgi:hypothetical protein